MTDVPPPEPFAAATRKLVEQHEQWDSLPQFVTLHWDGEKIRYGTVAVIDMHPEQYPLTMTGIAAEEIAKQDAHEKTLYAFALQVETFSVEVPKGADPATLARVQHARDTRTIHDLPESVEMCDAFCVDIHERMWTSRKRRNRPEKIEDLFFDAGSEGLDGTMPDALLRIARVTRMLVHRLPPPAGKDIS